MSMIRRKYTQEFKDSAVKLITEQGYQLSGASRIPVAQEAHRLSKGTYGARRIAEEIAAHGTPCGRTKAATIMRLADVIARQKKKFKVTTDSFWIVSLRLKNLTRLMFRTLPISDR